MYTHKGAEIKKNTMESRNIKNAKNKEKNIIIQKHKKQKEVNWSYSKIKNHKKNPELSKNQSL